MAKKEKKKLSIPVSIWFFWFDSTFLWLPKRGRKGQGRDELAKLSLKLNMRHVSLFVLRIVLLWVLRVLLGRFFKRSINRLSRQSSPLLMPRADKAPPDVSHIHIGPCTHGRSSINDPKSPSLPAWFTWSYTLKDHIYLTIVPVKRKSSYLNHTDAVLTQWGRVSACKIFRKLCVVRNYIYIYLQ